MNGAVTGNSEGKGSALCVGNIILNMQRDAKGDLEGVSMIFRMQVEPGAVAVVPGPIGRMQAKGPALPNAQQLTCPLEQWSADLCKFYGDDSRTPRPTV